MDKDWRPANWLEIKRDILRITPIVFSPSKGTIDPTDERIEKVASTIIKELLDAGLIHSQEQGSPEIRTVWFGAKPGEPISPNQNSESS